MLLVGAEVTAFCVIAWGVLEGRRHRRWLACDAGVSADARRGIRPVASLRGPRDYRTYGKLIVVAAWCKSIRDAKSALLRRRSFPIGVSMSLHEGVHRHSTTATSAAFASALPCVDRASGSFAVKDLAHHPALPAAHHRGLVEKRLATRVGRTKPWPDAAALILSPYTLVARKIAVSSSLSPVILLHVGVGCLRTRPES